MILKRETIVERIKNKRNSIPNSSKLILLSDNLDLKTNKELLYIHGITYLGNLNKSKGFYEKTIVNHI